MSRNIHGPILQRRRYSEELQRLFADLSGDHNPMHVDPVAARRTLVGGRAVHGIHEVLAALEALLAKKGARAIIGFKAQFLKPVLVGDVVALHLTKLTDEGCLVTGRIGGEVVCRTSIQFGPIGPAGETDLPPFPPEPVKELPFAALAEQKGQLALGLDTPLAQKLFPLTTAMLGTRRLAATLALSRLVGMQCPGLHSLFAEAVVRFDRTDASDVLQFRTMETEPRFSRIVMEVQGALYGQLIAFFRPPPQPQPGMAEVMRAVKSGDFAHSVALIVGGSRGLGEITAKIIAAGGGLPIITYHQGAAEAAKVAGEIRAQGGRCETLQLDVENSRHIVRQLGKTGKALRSVYYFATPKIFGRRRGLFDHDILRKFQEVYVTSFGRLVDDLTTTCPSPLGVFYPSSIAVTETIRELVEYSIAKRAGEELCAFYNENAKNIKIVVERLPRLKTDQTSSLIPLPARDTLEVMLPLVSRMEKTISS